jgi:anti-sigma factor RsiW
MVDPHTNGCPEPEVLAAYVDRGLSLSERARVDIHLASCPQCIALVAGVARTVEELSAIGHGSPRMPPPSSFSRAAASSDADPLCPHRARRAARDSGLVNLVDSVGEQRSVLGRLTGFPHALVRHLLGARWLPAGADRVQLTTGRIRESFGDRPSQMHAVGVS